MASGSKAIKAKIQTVGNIKKITNAMEMIARTKMKCATYSFLSMRPYALYARELLKNLASNNHLDNPYLKIGAGDRTLLLVIAADKGLCGGYNANIIRAVRARVRNQEKFDVLVIGKKALLEARKQKLQIIDSKTDIPDKVTAYFVAPLAQKLREEFLSGKYKTAQIMFTDYISAVSQKIKVRAVLPVSLAEVDSLIKESSSFVEKDEHLNQNSLPALQYLFEPDTGVILDTIVPRLVDIRIFHALLESKASEESMRMFAMKNATDNAQKMKDDLTLSFNRARQQSITQEIAEIAAGAEAIK